MANNNNQNDQSDNEYDFGDFNAPFTTTPVRAPRRVALETLSTEPPAQRPRLMRQNAMLVDRAEEEEARSTRIANRAAYFSLLRGSVETVSMVYVLPAAEITDPEWECSVCLVTDTKDTVWHPNLCHMFHEECLQRAMQLIGEKCPLCRTVRGPLFMRPE
jgi:hypothetical protein